MKKKGACNEARSSEEEHVRMRNSRRKGDFEHSNEKSNGKSSDEEENQLPKCGRKGDTENLNKKKNVNEEKEIGIHKCGRKSRIDRYNEEVRGWTSSSKNPECPPETTKTKEENRLENQKIKLKQVALEWDDLDMQAGLKYFMYVDRSLRAKKDKFIDELNFKKCMQLKRLLKSKLFVGITNIQRKYIIRPDFMVANQEITD